MSGTPAEILRARGDAAAARERIRLTLKRLKRRINPRVRAREKWEDVRNKGEALGDDALEFAYERPRVVAGVAGAGLLFLLRRPIATLARRLVAWRRRPKWDAKTTLLKNPAGVALPPPDQGGERR